MNHQHDSVLVIVPVRDFAKGWPRFVAGWREGLRKVGRAARFVVVDDGQGDPVADLAESDVVIVRHDAPVGLGECLRTGLASNPPAEDVPTLILIPDFGYRPSDVGDLFNAFKDVDMIIGARPGVAPPGWLSPVQRVGGWLRRWLFGIPNLSGPPWHGWAMVRQRWSYRFRFGPKLQDPGCGLVLVKKHILDRCPLQSRDGFALLELVAKANFLGALIAEVVVSKPSDMPTMKGRFEFMPADERVVFRRPEFNADQKLTAGNGESAEKNQS